MSWIVIVLKGYCHGHCVTLWSSGKIFSIQFFFSSCQLNFPMIFGLPLFNILIIFTYLFIFVFLPKKIYFCPLSCRLIFPINFWRSILFCLDSMHKKICSNHLLEKGLFYVFFFFSKFKQFFSKREKNITTKKERKMKIDGRIFYFFSPTDLTRFLTLHWLLSFATCLQIINKI